MTSETARRRAGTRYVLTKVPEATALFWVIKILTTGMGEAASDYMGESPLVIPLVAIAFVALVVAFVRQFRADRYRPATYWFATAMISVFGTMVADGVRVGLGVSYVVSATFFLLALAAILVTWYRSEGTLSIHSITTRRREVFYWATVVTTFALGTAAGDMTARSLNLGYLASGFMFAGIIAVPAIAYRFGLDGIVAFWFAYVTTRPLGASFADWMAVRKDMGGLGWGTLPVTFGLVVLILGFLALHVRALRGAQRAEDDELSAMTTGAQTVRP